MATSSIFQTVCVKDRKKVAEFVRALEQSKETKAKNVAYSRSVEHVTDEQKIKRLFEVGTDDGV